MTSMVAIIMMLTTNLHKVGLLQELCCDNSVRTQHLSCELRCRRGLLGGTRSHNYNTAAWIHLKCALQYEATGPSRSKWGFTSKLYSCTGLQEAWGFEKHRAFMSPQPTTWVHLKWALQEEANGASEANSTIVRAFKKLTI